MKNTINIIINKELCIILHKNQNNIFIPLIQNDKGKKKTTRKKNKLKKNHYQKNI